MPAVKFLGTDPPRRVRTVQVDDVVLRRGGEQKDLAPEQLERLRRSFPTYRFEVLGGELEPAKGEGGEAAAKSSAQAKAPPKPVTAERSRSAGRPDHKEKK